MFFFSWFANLDKMRGKKIRLSLQHQHKELCIEYKDVKSIEANIEFIM